MDIAATRRNLAAALALTTALATATAAVGPVEAPTVAASTVTATASTAGVVTPEVAAALQNGPATVIVRYADGGRDAVLAAVESSGAAVLHDLDLFDLVALELDTAALGDLLATGELLSVVLDSPVELADGGAPAGDAPDSTFVETIGADVLQAQGHDGDGVGIAIVDTVTEVTDLDGRVTGALDLSGESDNLDEVGHGTFIAGVAAGDDTAFAGEHAGVAPGAHIIPVKISSANRAADVTHVLAAMQYVVSMKDVLGIDVVNLSLGTDSPQPNALSPLNYAVQQAWDAGIVVVISAGNHEERGAGHIPKPADDPLVITVGTADAVAPSTVSMTWSRRSPRAVRPSPTASPSRASSRPASAWSP